MDLGEALSSRGLGQYFPRFTENEIDLDALSLLKTDDLVGLGIAEADRPPLLLLIKDLQPRGSEAASTPAPARPSPESVAALVSKMVTLGLGAAVSQEALAGCDFDLERAVDLAFSCGGDAKAVAQSFGRAPSTCGGAPAGGGEPDEAAVARHFAAADEAAAGDEDLPWAPSGWLEGDSLAPPCASDLAVVDALLSLARVGAADTVADLGAGDGRVCVRACLSRGAAAAWGVEIDEDEAAKFAANVAAFGLAGRCRVERGDLLALAPADLEGVTVLALYLLPEAIQAIRPLLDEALDVLGLRVVANTWGLPWREPAASTQAGAAGTPLFLYRGAGAAAAIAPDAAEPSGSGKVLSAEAKPFAPPPHFRVPETGMAVTSASGQPSLPRTGVATKAPTAAAAAAVLLRSTRPPTSPPSTPLWPAWASAPAAPQWSSSCGHSRDAERALWRQGSQQSAQRLAAILRRVKGCTRAFLSHLILSPLLTISNVVALHFFSASGLFGGPLFRRSQHRSLQLRSDETGRCPRAVLHRLCRSTGFATQQLRRRLCRGD